MSDLPPEVEPNANPAGFIVRAMAAGENATNTLAAFRESGGTMRTQQWYRIWGQVGDTVARSAEMRALAPDVLPAGADYGIWEMGRGGQYATQVTLQMRDADTGLRFTQQYTHVTNTPHTPQDAIDAAYGEFGDPDIEEQYGNFIEGGYANGVWQTVPWSE